MSKIGELGEVQGKRDAFHAAAVSARYVGEGTPKPGQNVKFEDDRCLTVVQATKADRHGVIDPFVPADQIANGNAIFWVMLVPGSTAELSHHFNVVIAGLKHVDEVEEEDEEEYDEDDGGGECRGCY